jgi:acyl-CoA reductase-like NAD-dependent aldehyde dehydrogenase
MAPKILLFIIETNILVMIVYGLAAAVFTQNINRAIETAHKLQAGTVWVSLLSLRRRMPN